MVAERPIISLIAIIAQIIHAGRHKSERGNEIS